MKQLVVQSNKMIEMILFRGRAMVTLFATEHGKKLQTKIILWQTTVFDQSACGFYRDYNPGQN